MPELFDEHIVWNVEVFHGDLLGRLVVERDCFALTNFRSSCVRYPVPVVVGFGSRHFDMGVVRFRVGV